jgi:hypothetical protein
MLLLFFNKPYFLCFSIPLIANFVDVHSCMSDMERNILVMDMTRQKHDNATLRHASVFKISSLQEFSRVHGVLAIRCTGNVVKSMRKIIKI